MQNDPLVEWQRLAETYSKMYDDELLQLAADSGDLTEQARQALGDEMRKRGIELPRARDFARTTFGNPISMPASMPNPMLGREATALGVDPDAPKLVSDHGESGDEQDGPHDFTWKTLLCECEDQERAWQVYEVLRLAGIESWIERPGARHAVVWNEQMVGGLQVQVAADQLEQARAIIANPIPQEIVEQSKMQMPEFELPVCPKCGAGDPVLEGVDPVNTWRCESCENEWAEAPADPKDEPEKDEYSR